ncbi:MAG: hypothetical protein ABI366_00310 [Ginsengibacter sp.]
MKLFFTHVICFFLFITFSITTNAQSSISLSTGISTDMNNSNKTFHHIPISLQWKPFADKKSPLFLEFDYDIPLINKRTGDAFTLNESLPQKVTLQENISSSIFTMAVGFRIHLYTNKKNNSFYLNILPVGICSQNFKVSYKNFDKVNYEVLNPDVNSSPAGFVMSMAAVYNFHKTKQDMMLMLHAQTPLLTSRGDYPLSYKYAAPLLITFGYNFYYNKRRK